MYKKYEKKNIDIYISNWNKTIDVLFTYNLQRTVIKGLR